MARWSEMSRRNEELAREIAFHIEELIRENMARGMSAVEARRRGPGAALISYAFW
jgi:hypothetical protein